MYPLSTFSILSKIQKLFLYISEIQHIFVFPEFRKFLILQIYLLMQTFSNSSTQLIK